MRHATASIFLVVAALGMTLLASPQEDVHVWNGVMRFSTGATVDVFLTVALEEEASHATIQTADGPVSPVADLVWDEQQLHFRWGAFLCALHEDGGGGYAGECEIDTGGTVTLAFEQPAELREEADRRSAGVASGGDVLTTDELMASGMLTMYAALQQLRPRWLIPRGPNKYLRRIYVYVYVDGQRLGDVEALRTLRPEDVSEVRYYNASEATQRFGAINEGGAIELRLRR